MERGFMKRGRIGKNINDTKIVEAYLSGKTLDTIASEFHINHETVRKHLHKQGIKCRRFWTGYDRFGAKHPRWKGGKRNYFSQIAYTTLVRANIDMSICMECGHFILENPHIHHKDGNWKNNNIENLEVLCAKCHYGGSIMARHKRKRDLKGRYIKEWSPLNAS